MIVLVDSISLEGKRIMISWVKPRANHGTCATSDSVLISSRACSLGLSVLGELLELNVSLTLHERVIPRTLPGILGKLNICFSRCRPVDRNRDSSVRLALISVIKPACGQHLSCRVFAIGSRLKVVTHLKPCRS